MTTGGLATAVALAGGAMPGGEADGEIADLFGDVVAPPVQAPARSGPQGGRPAGARNRSTEQWRRYLLSKYPHPLETLLALTTRKPADLAAELGLYRYHDGALIKEVAPNGELVPVLDTGAAAKILVDAATATLPYMAQKQPIAIETGGKVAGVLVIGDLAGVQDAGDGMLTLDLTPQQNQDVSEADIVRPDDAQSDASAKPMTNMGEFSE